MTLPPSIRINPQVPFPALVVGAGPVSVSKQNGIWTVQLNFGALQQGVTVPDPANTYAVVWDPLTGVFSLLQIGSFGNPVIKTTKVLTGVGAFASPYTALATDDVLIVKQAVGAPFIIIVDWSIRNQRPLRIVDGKGDASINNITIVPAAGQTQLALLNYQYPIDGNGGSITLTPLPDNSGAY